jgi:hypothetical protein
LILPECLRVLIDCGVFGWRNVEDQDDFEFGPERPCFDNGLEDFVSVKDAVCRNPERLARFGEDLAHYDTRIANVGAFVVGAGPDQLDLVDCALPDGGILAESFERYGEDSWRETDGLKGPWIANKWREFRREIDRAVDELNHLDRELKKLEARIARPSSPVSAN